MTGSTSITVLNVAPTIWGYGWSVANAGKPFQFMAWGYDPGLLDVLSFSWDLDSDGNYDDYTGQYGTHIYSTPGLHTIGLQLSDGDGGFAYETFSISVNSVSQTVPEPSSILLLGAGLAGLGYIRKRFRKS